MSQKNIKYTLFSRENIVQFLGLVLSFAIIHTIYKLHIRPKAETIAITQQVLRERDGGKDGYVPERNIYIILKNYEQESCFVLLSWAMTIIIYKLFQVYKEKKVMGETFVDIERGERIIPLEALSHCKHLESRLKNTPDFIGKLLPSVILTGLYRFHSTHSIQDVSQAVREISESEADRLDSDLSLVRYIAWAIPSVGFIGTVRGIGEALAQADRAIRGDIQGVTNSLGLAFNSTFVALVLSIFLMYFIHLLQSRQESLIFDVEEYCREKLIAVMKIPQQEETEFTFS